MPPKPKHQIRTAWATYLYLDNPALRGQFIYDFRQLLKHRLIKQANAGGGER
jgi:hypothetical protein